MTFEVRLVISGLIRSEVLLVYLLSFDFFIKIIILILHSLQQYTRLLRVYFLIETKYSIK